MRRLTFLVVVVLLGAACSDSADTTTTTEAPEATTATTQPPATTDPPATTQATTMTTIGPPIIALTGTECTSSIPDTWSGGALEIENKNMITMAVVMGTYNDGFGHDDLVAYGRDISTRPDFIDALEIYEVGPESTRAVSFDHGPGQFFTTCLDSTNTMIVLDDVTVGN